VLVGTLKAYDNGDLAVVGRAADHVSLGPAEAELDRRLGPGALDRLIAEAFARYHAAARPGGDAGRPGSGQPGSGQPGSGQPGAGGPEDDGPGRDTALALTRGVLVRALVPGSWMGDVSWDDVLAALFGPVAEVPFTG
jgi:hypothetical protein